MSVAQRAAANIQENAIHSQNAINNALNSTAIDFEKVGVDLFSKTTGFSSWIDCRIACGVQPFARTMKCAAGPVASVMEPDGTVFQGLNFTSQDYLSLNTHPEVLEAAAEAMRKYGVHSAGSAALSGNCAESAALESEIAQHLEMPEVILFPTGWAAGFGVIRALIRPHDHIVMDSLSHNCLQEGAMASTRNVHRFHHLDVAHAEEILQKIRKTDMEHGILVITEGSFSMDADSPDILAMQQLAREYNATMLLDIAHDFGSIGHHGQGQLEIQSMLGKVDLVMGSFSKTFASNGGFVASHNRSTKTFLKFFAPSVTFSNALSPVQVAVVRKALAIVRSKEGQVRREALMAAVTQLRQTLRSNGLQVLGEPSPIVPVMLGNISMARLAVREMNHAGLLANLVEFPAVARHSSRLRMQVMTGHSPQQAVQAGNIVAQAVRKAAMVLK